MANTNLDFLLTPKTEERRRNRLKIRKKRLSATRRANRRRNARRRANRQPSLDA